MHLALLLLLTVPAPRREDAAALLQQMQQAFRQAGALHARVEIQETPTGAVARTLRQELWIDRTDGRVRSEVRDPRRPEPHLTLIGGPQGLLLYHADARQMAQQPGSLDLGAALDATLAGELWRTAWRGELAGMKVESYGAPRLRGEEEVAGTRCWKIEFPGNKISTLWISQQDHLPRRLHGTLPGMARREEILLLEQRTRADARWFRFEPGPGVTVVPLAMARQRWSQLPPEQERWPAIGQPLPAFEAMGDDGDVRSAEDLPWPCVLAFWFEDHPPVRQALTQVQDALEPGSVALVSIHPGNDPDLLNSLVKSLGLTHEVWLDGRSDLRPFWSFAIASCPVFFLVDEDGILRAASAESPRILAAVRDLDKAPGHP